MEDQLKEDSKGNVKTKKIGLNQLKKVLEEYGCPEHWVDNQHAEDENDEMMKKELLVIGMKAGVGWARDDITGAALDIEEVRKARAEELDFFRKMGVYRKVPRWEANGKKIIKTRWIDVNKGDESNPDLRSRLVGKEYADSVDPSLYAATPPVEAMRMILSAAATNAPDGR